MCGDGRPPRNDEIVRRYRNYIASNREAVEDFGITVQAVTTFCARPGQNQMTDDEEAKIERMLRWQRFWRRVWRCIHGGT